MATKLIDLIESVNADDLPTNEFTIEDKDPMVILGKLNEVIAYLQTLQATINATDSKANEALQRAIQAVNDATQALSVANGIDSKATQALANAIEAVSTANTALSASNTALSTVNTAISTANTALSSANNAVETAGNALDTAESAETKADTAITTANGAKTTAEGIDAKATTALQQNTTIYTKFDTVTALEGATVSGTPKFLRYGKFYKFTSSLIIKGEWTLGGGYSGWSTPIAIATISGGNEALTTDELTYLNARFGVIGSGILSKKAYIENGTIYISVLQAAGGTNTITQVHFMQRDWTIIDYPDPMKYPIGSIYMSTNDTSPASIYGGTWERIKDRFLLGAGDSYSLGATGGSASVTLTGANLPNILGVGQNKSGVEKWISGAPWTNQPYSNEAWIITQKSYLNEVGNNYIYNQPHDNMPPYLAVYIWKRIA